MGFMISQTRRCLFDDLLCLLFFFFPSLSVFIEGKAKRKRIFPGVPWDEGGEERILITVVLCLFILVFFFLLDRKGVGGRGEGGRGKGKERGRETCLRYHTHTLNTIIHKLQFRLQRVFLFSFLFFFPKERWSFKLVMVCLVLDVFYSFL